MYLFNTNNKLKETNGWHTVLKDVIGQPWLGKPQNDETFLFSVSQ